METRIFLIFIFLLSVFCSGGKYEKGNRIEVIADRLFPTSNPSETYSYYSLAWCEPEGKASQDFASELTGSTSYLTKFEVFFQKNEKEKELCKKKLTLKELEMFKMAVRKNYFSLLYVDGLPIKVPVGEKNTFEDETTETFLYTTMAFKILHNKEHVISVEALQSENSLISIDKAIDKTKSNNQEDIKFSYWIEWEETDLPYHNRWEKYVSFKLFPEEIEIQWFSIINSLILVIILVVFVALLISRILTKDYAYYDEEENATDESGWKLLHGDIFRFPKHVNLLCAVLGNGVQLLLIIFFLLFISLFGFYYQGYSNRSLYATLFVLYILSTGIAGYISGKYYKQFGGKNWVQNVLLTTFIVIIPVFVIWVLLNTLAIFYNSSAAYSFKLIVGIVSLYALISFPLHLIGAITAKNFSKDFEPPVKTRLAKRQIPKGSWYKNGFFQFLISGFIPFSSIYIELFFFYISIWGQIMFTPFIILLIFFIILIIVTSCITISSIFIQISNEDYRWWSRSIYCGGASSFFIFVYSCYFYFFESSMHGAFQFFYYFGVNLIVSYFFFLILSSVGFLSSFVFLKRIYKGIKID